MTGYTTSYMSDTMLGAGGEATSAQLVQEAVSRAYTIARLRALIGKATAAVTRRHNTLRDLEHDGSRNIQGQSDRGTQTIPISRIRGSEGRASDFDARFNPLASHTRRRWISVATARLAGRELPPIDVIQVCDDYYVRDGHHRVSVARAFGQQEIDAHVTLWSAECGLSS